MNMFRLIYRLSLFAASPLLLGSSAYGQSVVIWNVAQTISGDTDVSTAGTLVRAFNLGPSSVPQVTLNGVLFESFEFPTSASVVLGDFAFSENPGFLNPGNNAGYALAPFSVLSSGYQTLLSSYGSSNIPTTITLTMSGLSSGQAYLFQWWNSHSTETGNGYNTTATAANFVTLDANVSGALGGVGQFVTGSFTASGLTQAIDFTGIGNPAINAFQLRAIPEPSSYAVFAGIGALCLAVPHRRRRQVHAWAKKVFGR